MFPFRAGAHPDPGRNLRAGHCKWQFLPEHAHGGVEQLPGRPEVETEALHQFRSAYGISSTVTITGPWIGQLDNDNESLDLEKPDSTLTPEMTEDLTLPMVQVEEVNYRDDDPWPVEADGNGASLNRLDSTAFANDPVNWTAGPPSPGSGGSPPADQSSHWSIR